MWQNQLLSIYSLYNKGMVAWKMLHNLCRDHFKNRAFYGYKMWTRCKYWHIEGVAHIWHCISPIFVFDHISRKNYCIYINVTLAQTRRECFDPYQYYHVNITIDIVTNKMANWKVLNMGKIELLAFDFPPTSYLSVIFNMSEILLHVWGLLA